MVKENRISEVLNTFRPNDGTLSKILHDAILLKDYTHHKFDRASAVNILGERHKLERFNGVTGLIARMFNSIRVQRRIKKEPGINMAPLIDMVFILLIFFLVTTTFIRETGIKVNKPKATTAESLEKENLLIGISSEGEIWFEQRRIGLLTLRSRVEKRLRERPGSPIVIVPDKGTQTGVLIDVMDECRLAGADRISVASKKEL